MAVKLPRGGAALLVLLTAPAVAANFSLDLAGTLPVEVDKALPLLPDQIPLSRVARGRTSFEFVWLVNATERYDHGVLGDEIEAGALRATTFAGDTHELKLPGERVFEDNEPRIRDIDGDGHEEILVVETHREFGASLAIYGLVEDALVKMAATPYLGTAYRWLNPLGAGDFDGDGVNELALVATPHIDGRLRLYEYSPGELALLAEAGGYSTHRSGSTKLRLGAVVPGADRDRLLVPDRFHESLSLLEFDGGNLRERASVALPGRLDGPLEPLGEDRWRVELENGVIMAVEVSETESDEKP